LLMGGNTTALPVANLGGVVGQMSSKRVRIACVQPTRR